MGFADRLDNALLLLETQKKAYHTVVTDLDALGKPYLVVGGMAVGHFGWDRFTKDLDIIMDKSDFLSLDDPRFEIPALSRPDKQFGKMTHKATGTHIDVLLGGGKTFPAMSDVQPSASDSHVISLSDLIILKTLRGDPSDLGDIYRMLKSGVEDVDWERVKARVSPEMWLKVKEMSKEAQTRREE